MASEPPPRRPRWRLQFGLRALMLVMLLIAIAAAALGGLLRATSGGASEPLLTFVILTLAAPLTLLMAVSLLHAAAEYWQRRK